MAAGEPGQEAAERAVPWLARGESVGAGEEGTAERASWHSVRASIDQGMKGKEGKGLSSQACQAERDDFGRMCLCTHAFKRRESCDGER